MISHLWVVESELRLIWLDRSENSICSTSTWTSNWQVCNISNEWEVWWSVRDWDLGCVVYVWVDLLLVNTIEKPPKPIAITDVGMWVKKNINSAYQYFLHALKIRLAFWRERTCKMCIRGLIALLLFPIIFFLILLHGCIPFLLFLCCLLCTLLCC